MRGLPVNESGKGSPESSNGSRVRHSILRQLATLETMSMDQLRERWRDLYGGEPPSYKRQFLIKRLAYRIQELFYGGLSEAAKTRLQQVAQTTRWPVWTAGSPATPTLTRTSCRAPGSSGYGRTRRYEVLAHENGFEYDGRMFRSLSAVAREITGTRWNGRLFFGLKKGNDAGGQHA